MNYFNVRDQALNRGKNAEYLPKHWLPIVKFSNRGSQLSPRHADRTTAATDNAARFRLSVRKQCHSICTCQSGKNGRSYFRATGRTRTAKGSRTRLALSW